jgi:hypothetical protein
MEDKTIHRGIMYDLKGERPDFKVHRADLHPRLVEVFLGTFEKFFLSPFKTLRNYIQTYLKTVF